MNIQGNTIELFLVHYLHVSCLAVSDVLRMLISAWPQAQAFSLDYISVSSMADSTGYLSFPCEH